MYKKLLLMKFKFIILLINSLNFKHILNPLTFTATNKNPYNQLKHLYKIFKTFPNIKNYFLFIIFLSITRSNYTVVKGLFCTEDEKTR